MMPPRDINGTTSEYPFTTYIQQYLERTDLSARALARQSADPETGQKLNHTYVSALAANDVPKAPELWRLRSLAAAMSKTGEALSEGEYRRRYEELKRLAAAQWLDLGEVLQVQTGSGSWVTVNVPPGLSEAGRQDVIRWAESMAKNLDQAD
ncbi:hypothetical protein ACIBHY_16940 [Nonomuraea sp. NPDC050547]|uniref:hypothetical protein n=1 Tax=unclassified Nonomuraea TaxID=2593643 RepID=UPI0037A3D22B